MIILGMTILPFHSFYVRLSRRSVLNGATFYYGTYDSRLKQNRESEFSPVVVHTALDVFAVKGVRKEQLEMQTETR